MPVVNLADLVKRAGDHPICQACKAAESHLTGFKGNEDPFCPPEYCSFCRFGQNGLGEGFAREDLEEMLRDVKEAAALYRSIADRVKALLDKWEYAFYCSSLYETELGHRMWQLCNYASYAGEEIIEVLTSLLENKDADQVRYWFRRGK